MRFRQRLRDNGLSIVLALLFLFCFAGQTWFGWLDYNEEQLGHSQSTVTLPGYFRTGHFIEATAENWESEFLQMFAYILLTVSLFQRGSSESKDPDKPAKVDRDPRLSKARDAPGPVRRRGFALKLYEYSLSLTFLVLFLISIAMHALGGAGHYSEEQVAHGRAAGTVWDYFWSSTFWFESFQNWQSEFLALLAMVVLSIYLRQRGSPESKPVDAPHDETGSG